MRKIFLVDLESIPTRYTIEWKDHIPSLLRKEGHEVIVISGSSNAAESTTPGAFINFGGTNIYKAQQVSEIGRLFCEGQVKAGDHFLFTDAWHPGVINLRYLASMMDIPILISGIWHAGSYDKWDFLGRCVGDNPWIRNAEKSFFHCYDYNFFTTDFHIKMFYDTLLKSDTNTFNQTVVYNNKIVKCGYPMEYMESMLEPYKQIPKRDVILFPHRLAPEKQPAIFYDLQEQLPQYEFITTTKTNLTKVEYHQLLGSAKLVFSASLQETLGIAWYEGVCVNAIPMLPDRLSYSEAAYDCFKYPSVWTEGWSNYMKHRSEVIDKIVHYMDNYESFLPDIEKQKRRCSSVFFSCNPLLKKLKSIT